MNELWQIHDPDSIVRPGNHRQLRAFLELVERANERHSGADLHALNNLARDNDVLGYDEITMREYIMGLIERLPGSNTQPEYYFTSSNSMAECKRDLYQVAYGDFTEAVVALRRDLASLTDEYRGYEQPDEHRIYDPSWFTPEQQNVWRVFTVLPEKALTASISAHVHIEDAAEQLARFEDYLDAVFGERCKVMTATYLLNHNNGQTVRAMLYNDTVQVVTQAPFSADIQSHIDAQLPLRSNDFNSSIFPKSIGDYELGDVDTAMLYPFEAF